MLLGTPGGGDCGKTQGTEQAGDTLCMASEGQTQHCLWKASGWKGDFGKVLNFSGPQCVPPSNGADLILGLLTAPCTWKVLGTQWFWSSLAPGRRMSVRAPRLLEGRRRI